MSEVWILCLPNSHDPGGEILSVHASHASAVKAAERYIAADGDRPHGRSWEPIDPNTWRSDGMLLEIERHEVLP